jgi:hypothetical protein
MLLGSFLFLLLGAAFEYISPLSMIDFKGLYYPARCLIQHGDPYSESEVLRTYQSDEANHLSDPERVRQVATWYIYQPTALTLTVPFAMLPWGPAHVLWMGFSFGSLIFASFLIWNLGADYAPLVSGALIGFLLANSEILAITGNVAGIAISLCAVGVWCFLRERFIPAGILCFALSLAVKPHITGLVWLYFLLAGVVYRKRALQTLVVTAALCLPAVLWVWHVSPHWMQELRSTLSAFSVHGGLADPGPASTGARGLGMLVNLQAVASFIRDDPRFYNPVSYLICGLLLLIWILAILKSRASQKREWLALAAIAALSLLPIYHRLYDAKLLLLTVPACAMLWAKGGLIGRLALLVNTAGLVLTGDIFWAFFAAILSNKHLPPTRLIGEVLMCVQVFSAPLILLLVGIFYLWIYVRCSFARSQERVAATVGESGLRVS